LLDRPTDRLDDRRHRSRSEREDRCDGHGRSRRRAPRSLSLAKASPLRASRPARRRTGALRPLDGIAHPGIEGGGVASKLRSVDVIHQLDRGPHVHPRILGEPGREAVPEQARPGAEAGDLARLREPLLDRAPANAHQRRSAARRAGRAVVGELEQAPYLAQAPSPERDPVRPVSLCDVERDRPGAAGLPAHV
jgi:hypothetical protein